MLALTFALALAGLLEAQPSEFIAAIRVHGNLATPDEEVIRIADVRVGDPVGPNTCDEVAARLRMAQQFQRVEVLKRFASIADPSQIVIVIVVDEGAVRIEKTGDPAHPTRVVRRRGPNLLVLPLLSAEDGYGLTYGGQIAWLAPIGKSSRLAFPLTWGGDKRAAVELDKDFERGPVGRIEAGGAVSRRTHPFFRQDEDRRRIWARAERELVGPLRVGTTAGWQHVSFLDAEESFAHVGADIVLDTRLDPALARNAVYARAAWDRLDFTRSEAAARSELEARGYIGLIGQSVLVVRVLRDGSSRPLPAYLKPMLGGTANLRGFRAGTSIGDTLVAGSAELRVPLTSPLTFGKMGVSVFTDAGTTYDKGGRLADQSSERGYGAGLWFSAAFVRLNLAVAHGVGASTRVHVSGGLSF